eukprot:5231972-Pyramimonas_sp.AAC.1
MTWGHAQTKATTCFTMGAPDSRRQRLQTAREETAAADGGFSAASASKRARSDCARKGAHNSAGR